MLYFYYDFVVVVYCGLMYLVEGCCSDGYLVELVEGARDPHAELAADDLLDLVEAERLDVVLQSG